MKIRVIDFETTGLPEDPRKAICEVGYTDLDFETLEIGEPVNQLIDPGHSIPPHMTAVHHILDRDVVGCPSPTDACRMLMDGMGEDDVFAAHGAKFEQYFFGGAARRWICTLKCSSRLWQDAPKHTNQVLRYWLELDLDERAMPPHRAGPDSFVTAHILRQMLDCESIDQLVEWTNGPLLHPKISFGQHKGTYWKDAPTDYLEWVVFKSTKLDKATIETAQFWLEQRR